MQTRADKHTGLRRRYSLLYATASYAVHPSKRQPNARAARPSRDPGRALSTLRNDTRDPDGYRVAARAESRHRVVQIKSMRRHEQQTECVWSTGARTM